MKQIWSLEKSQILLMQSVEDKQVMFMEIHTEQLII